MADEPLDAVTVRERPTPTGAGDTTSLVGKLVSKRYRILEHVGEGGMGAVYRARDTVLDADVALKRLHPDVADDRDKVAFFRNEVRIARRITHPNVCRLHDLDEGPDGCFITMEYVDGESLASRLRSGSLPHLEAMRILRAVAAGLAAAHAAGVIHRDLKPSNILLAAERVVIADFGIASEGVLLASGPQSVAGTVGYMAPEQARGEPLDARADVYAFGVLACVLLTGARPPPSITTVADVGGGSAHALPVADVTPMLEMLPGEVGALISSCLAFDRDQRPTDVGVVASRLSELRTRRRRSWPMVAALGGAVVLAALFAILALRDSNQTSSELALGPIDTRALAANERWLGDALARLIANEVSDAYGLDLELGTGRGGTLTRDARGTWTLTIDGSALSARSTHELATVAADRIASRVPHARQHPTMAELAAVGTTDVIAWRMWRRAQRHAAMQRWNQMLATCDEALRRDPGFPLAQIERAFSFDRGDDEAGEQLAKAQRLLDARPAVGSPWREAVQIATLLREGDRARAGEILGALAASPLSQRERAYLELRSALSTYFDSEPRTALVALEQVADRYPNDAAAAKALADYYVRSTEPTAAAHAIRNALRAVQRAPDDLGARIDLALAHALTGDLAAARGGMAEVDAAPPEYKQDEGGRLFTLHIQLGELAQAEVDARRELAGTPMQRASGLRYLALIDLYWGRFDDGIAGLEAAAAACDALGLSDCAALDRIRQAESMRRLGLGTNAEALFHQVGATTSSWARYAVVLEHVSGRRLAAARAALAAMDEGTSYRARAELAIAMAARDGEGVISASARLGKVSTSVAHLYDLGQALEWLGRDEEALATYERLARSTRSWSEPIETTLAFYRLGVLRAKLGDVRAREAFMEVVRRWESATTRVPELVDARARLRR